MPNEREIQRAFDTHDAAALVHVAPLARELEDDPDRAIARIRQVYDAALNDAYTGSDGQNHRAFVESHAGGPMETVPSAVYNVVGDVYPRLEKHQREAALRQILNILDGMNNLYVQDSHTRFIREPLLLADIVLCRRAYWPGIEDGIALMRHYSSFDELRAATMDDKGLFRRNTVASDFLSAVALMHGKYSSWGESYVSVANPSFLDRVYKGVVALDFGRPTGEEIASVRAKFDKVWPLKFREKLDGLLQERDWVDYTKFS